MPLAVELNGLLPGRGPGRGPPRDPGRCPAAGLPGRGAAGGLPGAGRGAAGRAAAGPAAGEPPAGWPPGAGAAVSCCAGGAAACGAATCGGDGSVSRRPGSGAGGTGGTGGWAPSATGPVAGPRAVTSAGAAAAARPFEPSAGVIASVAAACSAGRLLPGLPAGACLGCWAASSSLSLRTTGASIVEDAERTNSPISWSLAITALLSTPNSFASS